MAKRPVMIITFTICFIILGYGGYMGSRDILRLGNYEGGSARVPHRSQG